MTASVEVKTVPVKPAEEVLVSVRPNLGLPDKLLNTFLRTDGRGRASIAMLHQSFSPVLKLLFALIKQLSWKLKNKVTLAAWYLWLSIHKVMPRAIARRGLSPSLSLESHAMNNVLWWIRLFPAPLWVTRFGLSQLSVQRPPSGKVRTEKIDLPESGVRGLYLHTAPRSDKKPNVLMWFFGGAYIGGDVEGNAGIAEHYGRRMKCDVFLVDMRLCPEHKVQEAVLDAYRAYAWLLTRASPQNIMFLGISSGGGTCVRLLQLALASEKERLEYFGESMEALAQPAGAILLGPFVKYDEFTPSMQKFTKIDWIVNQSVMEAISPLKDEMCGGAEKIVQCSPLNHSMEGLCPLLVSVSEHECLIDEDTMLANKARDAGVEVELHVQPYMPHVFQLLAAFLPEAQDAEDRIVKWACSRGGTWE